MYADEGKLQELRSLGVQMSGDQHDYTTPEGQKYLDEVFEGGVVDWRDRDLKRITILRLISDPGFPMWDVSYCHGERQDGTLCRVHLPFHQLEKRRWKSEIVAWAREDGVWAKGLGIFDAVSTLQ